MFLPRICADDADQNNLGEPAHEMRRKDAKEEFFIFASFRAFRGNHFLRDPDPRHSCKSVAKNLTLCARWLIFYGLSLLDVRIERVISEDRPHVHLTHQRLDVRSKTMKDGNDVFLLGRRKDLLRKSLESLAIFVK